MQIYFNGKVSHYKDAFPNTSFPASGPSDSFLAERGAVKVSLFREHNRATQKLVACDPVVENGFAFIVAVAVVFVLGTNLCALSGDKYRIAWSHYTGWEPWQFIMESGIIDKWGKKNRITQCLKTLGTYGAAAKTVLPQLRQLEKDLLAHKEARMLKPVIEQTQALIKGIENATGTVVLRSMDDL